MAAKTAQAKVIVASKFRNSGSAASNQSAPRRLSQSAVSNADRTVTGESAKLTRKFVPEELPKGVKSAAALRNKQKQENGVVGDVLKTAKVDLEAQKPQSAARCTGKTASQIREKLRSSEMAKVLDSKQACDLPVQKPRCQGSEALRNRAVHTNTSINFKEMYDDAVERDEVKPKLGISAECMKNYKKNQQSQGMANSLSHDYERALTPPPPPRVTFSGIENASRMHGEELHSVMHSEATDWEQPKPRVTGALARSLCEKHRGSGDAWLRCELEGDEMPAPRVRYGGQKIAEGASGATVQRVLKENEGEPEAFEPPPQRMPSQAARRNYDKSVGTAMKQTIFSDYRNAPLEDKPVSKTRSSLAKEVQEHSRKGTTHLLFYQYGKLSPDPQPSPTLRYGARGNYVRNQGGEVRQLMHRETFHGLPRHLRRRPKTAS